MHTCMCHGISHLDCSCFFLGGKGASCRCVGGSSSSISMSHKISRPPAAKLEVADLVEESVHCFRQYKDDSRPLPPWSYTIILQSIGLQRINILRPSVWKTTISCPGDLLAGTILGDAAPSMKMTVLLPATFIAASLQDCLLLLLHPGITAAATSHCYYCLLRFLATATLLFPTVAATSYCNSDYCYLLPFAARLYNLKFLYRKFSHWTSFGNLIEDFRIWRYSTAGIGFTISDGFLCAKRLTCLSLWACALNGRCGTHHLGSSCHSVCQTVWVCKAVPLRTAAAGMTFGWSKTSCRSLCHAVDMLYV